MKHFNLSYRVHSLPKRSLDIKIFFAMNGLIKEKIKVFREKTKILDVKKESYLDKIKMQKNFIDELENRGKENIQPKEDAIQKLLNEENDTRSENDGKKSKKFLQTELENYSGASDKLQKLGNLKGKSLRKFPTITKEHKFFNDHTVCPTCDQDIEEEFLLNRVEAAQSKAKELQSGYNELKRQLKRKKNESSNSKKSARRLQTLNHEISTNNSTISGIHRQIRQLESEIQTVTSQLENRNSEHEKLLSFQKDLDKLYDDLSGSTSNHCYYDFAFSLLKDGGVKRQIIKSTVSD